MVNSFLYFFVNKILTIMSIMLQDEFPRHNSSVAIVSKMSNINLERLTCDKTQSASQEMDTDPEA